MLKRLFKKRKHIDYYHYTDKDWIAYLQQEIGQSEEFHNHCQEVADNLKINKQVVYDMLFDYAFQTLRLLQQKSLEKKKIKIQHYSWFRMVLLPRQSVLTFKKYKP